MDVIKTDVFDKWLRKLKDRRAISLIEVHINRIVENKLGVVKPLGEGVHEKKINYGPGYRLYFINHGMQIVVLLCAGDKSTQQKDIQRAKLLAREWRKQ